MMRYIKTYKIFESVNQIGDWPENWKGLPEWDILRRMGFNGGNTENGNISVSVNYDDSYKDTFTLTKNGYIRRPGVNGYVDRFKPDASLGDMFIALADRSLKPFEKYCSNRGKNNEYLDVVGRIEGLKKPIPKIQGITEEEQIVLDQHVNGRWKVKSNGLIEIDGNFEKKPKFRSKFLKRIKNRSQIISGLRFGDITGSVDLDGIGLSKLPRFLGSVRGDFRCCYNRLVSLDGAPQVVGGDFVCYANNLTSLKGAPQKVLGGFYIGGDGYVLKWTTEGKIKYMEEHQKWIPLILPTLPHDIIIEEVSKDPKLLKSIEDFDKNLYARILKDLGWDKMGPDLLRQLKNGIL